MKNFLLFIGEVYYPNQGFGDFYGDFETFAEAEKIVNDLKDRKLPDFDYPYNNYACIIDCMTRTQTNYAFDTAMHDDSKMGVNPDGEVTMEKNAEIF